MTQRVLVVDDDRISRLIVRHMLGSLGYASDEAADVAGGRRFLDDEEYAVLISDLQLPDGSGLDLFDVVRATTPQPAFVLVTGTGERRALSDARVDNVEHYLTKPLSTTDLDRVLVQILGGE
ncbi:MAG: two-component system, chemotaxis family, chemotaxis protein CheY [Actinomycetota bacterium]|nr:two-component system, chemotaxis family, chemotaxis protein CheY [Actinomycetota bacterium]